jgi:nucleoside-diphosphate-sugar epimerase
MKLALFGATGAAGILLTQKALAAGHGVVVYARNPSKMSIAHERLTLVKGELNDESAIDGAIQGRDAVISLLGPTPKSSGRPLTLGMSAIVAAMKRNGVRRLIAISTPSSPDPADGSAFSFGLAVRMVRTLVAEGYADIVGEAEVVRASDLDWTVVRLPMLTNKEGSSPPAAGYIGSPGIRLFWLSRNVLADFLLSQLDDSTWLRKAPVISNRK